jgi:hypothetical protein
MAAAYTWLEPFIDLYGSGVQTIHVYAGEQWIGKRVYDVSDSEGEEEILAMARALANAGPADADEEISWSQTTTAMEDTVLSGWKEAAHCSCQDGCVQCITATSWNEVEATLDEIFSPFWRSQQPAGTKAICGKKTFTLSKVEERYQMECRDDYLRAAGKLFPRGLYDDFESDDADDES